MKIKEIQAREILDSRSNPTIEVKMILDDGSYSISSVPSGASTGSKEALELRDKDVRYHGKGVLKAVENVNNKIAPLLIGMELNQSEIDKKMLEFDGTENKSNLGANAILGVSLCTLKCLAKVDNKELFEYVSDGIYNMPIPMINVINGGAHADNNLDIQEFMLVPVQNTEKERIRCASEIFITLKGLLKEMKLSTGVGDEGGFAPNLDSNEKALDLLVDAIKKSNYIPGKDVYLALDCAASEFFDNGLYHIDNKNLTKDELLDYYIYLIKKYPIISIEDPFEENDYDSFRKLSENFNNKIMIVGDDLFVSSAKYLEQGINNQAGNAILLKANQVGTITEFFQTIKLAKENNYKTIISHRSGETLDTFIADLGVGLNIDFIKTGSVSRGERIAKYNRLMEIEEKLN